MLDYGFLLKHICAVRVRGGVTASMETRASQKDEELEDEMRTYYSRERRRGLTVWRGKCARNVCAAPERHVWRWCK